MRVKNELKSLECSAFSLSFPIALKVDDCDVMQAACNKHKCTFPVIFSLKLVSCVIAKCKAAYTQILKQKACIVKGNEVQW